MKQRFNLTHPYFLAVIVATVSFGTLIYIGLTAPTPRETTEAKGATTGSILYSKNVFREYGDDLVITDQSAIFGNEFVDQQQVNFTAYSGTSVTYDLFKITNKTDKNISLKLEPKRVSNPNMRNLSVNILMGNSVFEFYKNSERANQDLFALTLRPYESKIMKMAVVADELRTDTITGEIIFQIREL